MEAPLAEADPTPGRRWNAWEIAPIHGVDTAGIGLLRIRVWRFRRPRITGAVERRVFLVGANPTQRLSLPLVAARAIHGGNDMG